MKKIFRTLCGLWLASLTLTSCLGDDNEDTIVITSDVAITQFTLGTLNRYTQTTSATTGNDTVIKSTVAGSSYSMTIDQLGRQIYNSKPLPLGTDLKHVVVTVTAKNGSPVALQSMTSDSLSWHNAADSVDFTVPRVFRVYALDGLAHRDYTVTLTASASEGLDFAWLRVATVAAPADDERLVSFGDSVRVAPQGTVTRGHRAYRVGSQGRVETSADLEQWTVVEPADGDDTALDRLIGASTGELYALATDGRLMVSRHPDGATWAEEQLDEPAELLPDSNIAVVSWPYSPVDDTDYVLMCGTNSRRTAAEAASACVWRKLSCYATGADAGQWVYMPLDDANRQKLPAQAHLSLARYENVVLAVGDDLTVRQSRDQGITWPVTTTYALPATLQADRVSIANDTQGRLWLLTDSGELWQGQLR